MFIILVEFGIFYLMTHIQELFIRNLRFYRNKSGFTQLDFSEKIGLSPNYLNAVENGKNFPSSEVMQRMIDVLGIMPYQLFLEHPETIPSEDKQKVTELKQRIISLFEEMEAK